MGEMPWVLVVIVLVGLFVVGWGVAHLMFRAFRSEPRDLDEEATREAEALKERADKNVEGAEEVAARVRRLEELMAVQQRGGQSQRRWRR